MGTSVSPCLELLRHGTHQVRVEKVIDDHVREQRGGAELLAPLHRQPRQPPGRGLHSLTLELNLSNSRTHS